MSDLGERIIDRAERKIHGGENHFAARGVLASIALALMVMDDTEVGQTILLDTNKAIVDSLRRSGAEGEVYALREDFGSGKQDSTDYVLVTKRDGVETGAERGRTSGVVILRATTAEIDG